MTEINPVAIASLVVAAISALYAFYKSEYWPAKQKEREVNQAFTAKTTGDALTQILDINKNLVDNLIERSKVEYKIDAAETALMAKIDELKRETDQIRRDLAVISTRSQFDARDRERLEEAVDSVDGVLGNVQVMFSEIKGTLMGYEVRVK